MSYRRRPARSTRERAIAEWRGYWEPQDVSGFQHTMSRAVEDTLKGLGLENRFHEEQIFEAWNEMVSGFIAQNARPVGLHRKVLSIQVLHSVVFYELERMKGKLLAKLQEQFGPEHIKEIRFRLG